ncbi:hypothetical protein LTR64_000122 [Lithohypha guttulata]|uniref:uncharacterized protein n=1 Tax=Lithohypha guttulata TaxID=1690604 RepID=UPI002DDFCB57|nr:hypothetical protein LTR51_007484 [Lithohypha guttulata]
MSTTTSPGDRYAGAGLSLASSATRPDDAQVQKSQQSLASRTLALSSYFLSGALCINLSQFLGTPLYLINQDWYNAWIAFTKQSFGLLTMTLTQAFSPTKVIVSGDKSVRGQLLRQTDGTLLLDFPERLVLIANHQIYTDWLYLWWTAYCSGMHGRLYIILKESLKRIPILGWGMQFNQFIFLKRNWEQDRSHMAQALGRLNKLAEPMWLLLFPEGTNLARSTREKSAKWAAKNNMKDMRHCLLPRSTGLRFCIQELKDSVEYVYDCTIAYEGVPRGAYAQDIFTLKSGYLEGRPPKSVSMYWRRFAIKDIPYNNEKAFELWLLARWREKDLLIENYLIHGHFPADTGVTKTAQGQTKRGAGHLNVEIRSNHWYEFLQIFAPMGILAMVLYVFYGALPQKFFKSETGRAVQESTEDLKTIKNAVSMPSMPESFSLDMIFDKDKQAQTFGNAGMSMAKWIQSSEAQRMLNRVDLVQKWLQDPQKLLVESLAPDTNKQNFLKTLKEEEDRRKRMTNKHQGTFWADLEDAETKTKGSVSGKKSVGSFYTELAARQSARRPTTKLTQENLKKKATFWTKLEEESTRRAGSVFTLPTLSSSTSATAIDSMNSGSTAVGSAAPSSKALRLASKPAPNKLEVTKTQPQTKRTPVKKKGAIGGSSSTTAKTGTPKLEVASPSKAPKSIATATKPMFPTNSSASTTPATKLTKKPMFPTTTSTTSATKKAKSTSSQPMFPVSNTAKAPTKKSPPKLT